VDFPRASIGICGYIDVRAGPDGSGTPIHSRCYETARTHSTFGSGQAVTPPYLKRGGYSVQKHLSGIRRQRGEWAGGDIIQSRVVAGIGDPAAGVTDSATASSRGLATRELCQNNSRAPRLSLRRWDSVLRFDVLTMCFHRGSLMPSFLQSDPTPCSAAIRANTAAPVVSRSRSCGRLSREQISPEQERLSVD